MIDETIANYMKDTLVSIIVPAYKVEAYLAECLLSILNQTHKKFEVIVVDDGSPDNSGKIADEFAASDNRVRVIHQKNAGVSSARNCGIEESKGDYIIFVDGDDYLADDYLQYMLALTAKTGAEFCLSKYCYMKVGEGQTENDNVENLTPEDATALLLSPVVVVGCWNKIYKRSLIIDNNIRFATQLFYGEGLNFITTMAQIANSVGVGERKVYYYRRNNANSATTMFNIKKFYNGEEAIENIRRNLRITSSKISTMLKLHSCLFSMGAIISIIENHLEDKYPDDYKRWKSHIRHDAIRLALNSEISSYTRLKLICVWFTPWLMMKLSTSKRSRAFEKSV